MKLILTIVAAFCIISSAISQEIKKMSVDELSEYISKHDKPLVVNFWATWCSPCIQEIPFFISQVKEKKDSVDLLLVSLDIKTAYPGGLRDFSKARGFHAPIAWLSESNADVFCPRVDPSWDGAIPVTLMIDNKKGYRKFYDRALTDSQFAVGLKEMMGAR